MSKQILCDIVGKAARLQNIQKKTMINYVHIMQRKLCEHAHAVIRSNQSYHNVYNGDRTSRELIFFYVHVCFKHTKRFQ